MSVLSDTDILEFIRNRRISIQNFSEENVTPNGYDLTIEEVYVPAKDETIRAGIAAIPPVSRFAVSSKEVVELGRDVTAQLWLRTSWARKGIIASFGKVDAGFRGALTLAAFNSSSEFIEIPIGGTFAQIVFDELRKPASVLYAERSGNYQDQKGVTLLRPQDRKRIRPAKGSKRGPP